MVWWKDDSRFIVTNYHVVDAYYSGMKERPADTWEVGHWRVRDSLRITISNRQNTVGSKILYGNAAADIAVLSANGVSLEGEPLRLANPESAAIGDAVAVYGYATVPNPDRYDRIVSGIRHADEETGIIAEIGAFPDKCRACTVAISTDKLRISAISTKGDSGGPVINTSGAVLGMLYAGSANDTIAVHVSHIADAVNEAWLDSFSDN